MLVTELGLRGGIYPSDLGSSRAWMRWDEYTGQGVRGMRVPQGAGDCFEYPARHLGNPVYLAPSTIVILLLFLLSDVH